MDRLYKGFAWLVSGLVLLLLVIIVIFPKFNLIGYGSNVFLLGLILLALMLPFFVGVTFIVLAIPKYADKYGWNKKHIKFMSLAFAVLMFAKGLNGLVKSNDIISMIALSVLSLIFIISYFNLRRHMQIHG